MPAKETPLSRYPGIFDRGEAYRGKRYSVRYDVYVDGRRAQRRQGFDRLRDAVDFQTQTEAALLTGAVNDPARRRQTLREYGEAWYAKMVGSWDKGTATRHRTVLKRHIYPSQIGDRPLGSIERSDIQQWLNQLGFVTTKGGRTIGEPPKASTARNYLSTLTAMFTTATQDRVLTHNPCDGLKLPQSEDAPIVALDDEQVQSIIDALPERYKLLARLGAGAGLRISEALALTVDRIDLTPGEAMIRVDRQWRHDGRFGKVKTRSSKRDIPITDTLALELLAHMAQFPPGEHHYPDARPGFPGGAGHLVTSPRLGKAVWHPNWSDIWTAAIRPLGLDAAMGHEKFHALRHHYVSVLLAGGHDELMVAHLVGHDNPAITSKTYAHLVGGAPRYHADVRQTLAAAGR